MQALQALFEAPEGVSGALGDAVRRARSLADLLGYIAPASATPINGELSPHRRLDWLTMPLADLLELRAVLECTVNDLVLAIVAGALRRYLFRRRVDVNEARLPRRHAGLHAHRRARAARTATTSRPGS